MARLHVLGRTEEEFSSPCPVPAGRFCPWPHSQACCLHAATALATLGPSAGGAMGDRQRPRARHRARERRRLRGRQVHPDDRPRRHRPRAQPSGRDLGGRRPRAAVEPRREQHRALVRRLDRRQDDLHRRRLHDASAERRGRTPRPRPRSRRRARRPPAPCAQWAPKADGSVYTIAQLGRAGVPGRRLPARRRPWAAAAGVGLGLDRRAHRRGTRRPTAPCGRSCPRPTGSAVFVGGLFHHMNGANQPHLVAINPISGALQPWKSHPERLDPDPDRERARTCTRATRAAAATCAPTCSGPASCAGRRRRTAT